MIDALVQLFGQTQQWLFEAVVQPLLFALGQGALLEDAYNATGWLLVGLLHSLTGSYMPTATLVIVLSAAMALAGWGAGRNLLVQVSKA